MIRCYIQTLIISQAVSPSVLVLRPYSDEPVQDTCRVLPIWIGLTEATQMGPRHREHSSSASCYS